MKTSGVSCETKFGLLVFLGHPSEQGVEKESVFCGLATLLIFLIMLKNYLKIYRNIIKI